MRVIRALSDGDMHTVKEVAKIESIPVPFAYKVVEKLNKAGYLANYRGRSGGIRLVYQLDKITLFDVVTAIDSERHVKKCIRGENVCPMVGDKAACKFHTELARIQQVLVDELKSRTIKEVLAI